MKIVNFMIRIEQEDLDTILKLYPFFEYGKNYWDRNMIYFINKNLGDRDLEMDYHYHRTPSGIETTVRIWNRGCSMNFDLKLTSIGGTLKCLSGRINKEMYFMFFDYGIEVSNKVQDLTEIKRVWNLNKILNY